MTHEGNCTCTHCLDAWNQYCVQDMAEYDQERDMENHSRAMEMIGRENLHATAHLLGFHGADCMYCRQNGKRIEAAQWNEKCANGRGMIDQEAANV